MPTLTERFDAVQDQILSLIERGSTRLADHVVYWDLVRKEGVLQYYARRQNMTRLGLLPLPSQLGAEHKAKKAIQMGLLLRSLAESPFANETWTVTDTSVEVYEQTDPEKTFKKNGQTIEVWYDNDPENSVAYTLWRYIYKQDENGQWHKLEGRVDYAGLYYIDPSGMRVYYEDFFEDADRYGHSSTWTVKGDKDISAPVTSSDKSWRAQEEQPKTKRRRDNPTTSTPEWDYPETSEQEERPQTSTDTPRVKRQRQADSPSGRRGRPWSESTPRNGRGGREQREPSPDTSPINGGGLSYDQIGSSHTTVPRRGIGRGQRLLLEARDPPVILITGPANSLKCWRNRVRRRPVRLFDRISTCFSWVTEGSGDGAGTQRLLIAFKDETQRELFLKTVPLPRGSKFFKGNLDGL
uniref:Regulatory protein E2 n=1 Tax=Phodopus sungorus papillomavirus 1 TaxID=1487796 RepID=A0A078BNG6_9PAPI|nr:E2 protein [Phodopus sungorus papillomavirus 1]QWC92936.1 E2 [Phodopus sungorus papillomavirus 1]QWC92942.1 E2 [Phodopus sungorus papillomavirus 1]QWC92948.1 E2 [Phodopus sungorus papillomavirus 1]CDX10177.1 E2 protein [Phodopus sungorus papillomavirus 1]